MKLKTVVFYSVDGGVGKTTLATVAAIEKGRALVIDGDWEKADLSTLFNVPQKAGWLHAMADGRVYIHKVNPTLYVVPGYDAMAVYQSGKISDDVLFQALVKFLEKVPNIIAAYRYPVDTIIVDTPKAMQLTWLETLLKKFTAIMVFLADRRLVTRVMDVKTQIYSRYMRYASIVIANKLEKEDEKAPGIKMVNAYLTHVKMPNDYSAEKIHNAILSNRTNRSAIELLIRMIVSKR